MIPCPVSVRAQIPTDFFATVNMPSHISAIIQLEHTNQLTWCIPRTNANYVLPHITIHILSLERKTVLASTIYDVVTQLDEGHRANLNRRKYRHISERSYCFQ